MKIRKFHLRGRRPSCKGSHTIEFSFHIFSERLDEAESTFEIDQRGKDPMAFDSSGLQRIIDLKISIGVKIWSTSNPHAGLYLVQGFLVKVPVTDRTLTESFKHHHWKNQGMAEMLLSHTQIVYHHFEIQVAYTVKESGGLGRADIPRTCQ